MTVISLPSPKSMAIPDRPRLTHNASIAVAARYNSYLYQIAESVIALSMYVMGCQDMYGVLSVSEYG